MTEVKLYEVEFFKYPDDIKEGEKVLILDEAQQKGKYMNFQMTIELPTGVKKLLSINRTTLTNLVSKYGNKTEKWIGKFMVYRGKKKCGKMEGRVWEAE